MDAKKVCERCKRSRVAQDYRFCWQCLGQLLAEMRRAGYFKRPPRHYTDPPLNRRLVRRAL